MKGLGKKKGVALLLCVSMLSGMSLSAVDSIKTNAAEKTTAPSVTAYASKDYLKAPDENYIGKIKFGKRYNSTVTPTEDLGWYVLGSDSSISKDNTVIFAASNMISGGYQAFNADYSNEKDYADSMGDYTTNPEKVLPNHYGASDIRTALKGISDGTSEKYKNLLSSAEISMLNATTVRTDDFRGSSKTDMKDTPSYYTTSDKLYLPAWDYRGQKAKYPSRDPKDFEYVYIGSESDRKTPSDAQWNSSEQYWFWLRSPYSGSFDSSLHASPGGGVFNSLVRYIDYGVRPASNLDLSSVLFASSAVAASSDTPTADSITAGTAMNLRLDGKNKNIGSVKASGDTISVTRGSTSQTVALVVQGKGKNTSNEEIDWYYSEVIPTDGTTPKTVEASTIKTTVGLADEVDVDLSACKIWLEITDTDGMIYAVDTSYEPTHEHTFDGTWTPDATDHWHQCTPANACDKSEGYIKDKDGHTFNENGHCTVCDYDVSVDDWKYKEPVAATCKDNGTEEYWIYNVNGNITFYKFSGEYDNTALGVKEKKLEQFTDMDDIKTDLDPNNHVEERTYKDNKNSSTHLVLCAGCSAELGTASHEFVGNKCKDCGYTKSSNSGGGSSGGSSNTNTGWIKDSKGWRFRNSDGTLAQGTTVTDSDGNKVEKVLWQKAGNGYYAFGSDGYLLTGWIYDKLEDKWYYCDENLGKLYGWFNEAQDGYWYYLSPSTGEALTGWHSINGKDYYFAAAPSAPTYSFDASTGFWIYSNLNGNRPFGSMYANTVTPDNYQVDANGAWIH